LATGVIGAMVPPAKGCPIALPYQPLTGRPATSDATILIDVVAVDPHMSPLTVRVRVLRTYRGPNRTGAMLVLRYPLPLSPCSAARDPERGQRLVVYLAGGKAVGWATTTEAKRFDPDPR